MKKILIVVAVFAISLWGINTYAPIHGEEKIYDSVVRLHVIANSDSEADQTLKLAVRDAILEKSRALIGEAVDRESAAQALEESLDRLAACAEAVIKANGFDYPCRVTLTEEKYPQRSYEGMCFPSGSYCSLQVKIGEHEGQNFWCVLFPSLCLDVATNA